MDTRLAEFLIQMFRRRSTGFRACQADLDLLKAQWGAMGAQPLPRTPVLLDRDSGAVHGIHGEFYHRYNTSTFRIQHRCFTHEDCLASIELGQACHSEASSILRWAKKHTDLCVHPGASELVKDVPDVEILPEPVRGAFYAREHRVEAMYVQGVLWGRRREKWVGYLL